MRRTETDLYPYGQKIVAWMATNGHPEYASQIEALRSDYDLTIGESGRYWSQCPFTRESLAKIANEIQEVTQSAIDRYEDWASN